MLPGNINHVKCQRLAGGLGGAAGPGTHLLSLESLLGKCTFIYVRSSGP